MCSNWAPLDLVKHFVLIEILVKILSERAVICREFFFFDYNFRIGQNIFFIFANILRVINFTNAILTFKKLTNTSNKLSWVVQTKLALK